MPIKNFDPTPASNLSSNGISIAENCPFANWNNYARQTCADLRNEIANVGANVASAATPTLDVDGAVVTVTGVTTITGWATAITGLGRTVYYETATPHTNSSTLKCPGGANFTSAKGDVLRWRSFGAGAWAVEHTQLASGGLIGTISSANIPNNTVIYADMQDVSAASRLLGRGSAAGSGDPEEISLGTGLSMSATTLSATSKIAQVVAVASTTADSTATAIPYDNTIPQITEGKELLSTAFVPTNSSSTILITVSSMVSIDSTGEVTGAVFVDATANALFAQGVDVSTAAVQPMCFSFTVAAGSTASRTYRFRYGPNANNAYINRSSGGAKYGGVAASTMTITEILP